jgi:hypothetical protein
VPSKISNHLSKTSLRYIIPYLLLYYYYTNKAVWDFLSYYFYQLPQDFLEIYRNLQYYENIGYSQGIGIGFIYGGVI